MKFVAVLLLMHLYTQSAENYDYEDKTDLENELDNIKERNLALVQNATPTQPVQTLRPVQSYYPQYPGYQMVSPPMNYQPMRTVPQPQPLLYQSVPAVANSNIQQNLPIV